MHSGLLRTMHPPVKSGCVKSPHFEFYFAGLTHPGGVNKQNQDDFFVHHEADHNFAVFGVFDGHGREVGKLGANAAREYVELEIQQPNMIENFRTRPRATMRALFRGAHLAVKQVGLLWG